MKKFLDLISEEMKNAFEAAGYDGALAMQGDAALFMIRALASVIPFVFYVVIIFVMKKVKLDEKLKDYRENLSRKAEG